MTLSITHTPSHTILNDLQTRTTEAFEAEFRDAQRAGACSQRPLNSERWRPISVGPYETRFISPFRSLEF